MVVPPGQSELGPEILGGAIHWQSNVVRSKLEIVENTTAVAVPPLIAGGAKFPVTNTGVFTIVVGVT